MNPLTIGTYYDLLGWEFQADAIASLQRHRNPLGHERFCMARMDEDGKSELTVVLIFDGQEHTLVLHNENEQKAAVFGGWAAFVSGG